MMEESAYAIYKCSFNCPESLCENSEKVVVNHHGENITADHRLAAKSRAFLQGNPAKRPRVIPVGEFMSHFALVLCN